MKLAHYDFANAISQNVYFCRGEKGEAATIKMRNEKFLISHAKFAFCQVGGKAFSRHAKR